MARKNNFDNPDKKRVSINLPTSVIDEIKATAEEKNVSASYLYTQLVCEGYSHYKTQRAIKALQGDVDTIYLGLELIGGKLDEIVRLIGMRVQTPQNLSPDEKETLKAKASALARNVSNTACSAVREYRTGESSIDPLGVEKLLKYFSEHLDNKEIESDNEDDETDN